MQRDLVAQMSFLAERLGLERSPQQLLDLAPSASFDAMKASAERLVPNADQGLWKSESAFFRSGTSGEWNQAWSAETLRLYEARLRELASDDLIQWMENGSLR